MNRNYKSKHNQENTRMEERISGDEDTIEEIDSLVKDNIKSNKFLTQKFRKSGTP